MENHTTLNKDLNATYVIKHLSGKTNITKDIIKKLGLNSGYIMVIQ